MNPCRPVGSSPPLVGPAEDFHPQVVRPAGRTIKKKLPRMATLKKKKEEAIRPQNHLGLIFGGGYFISNWSFPKL
jgi:hypothetical protein